MAGARRAGAGGTRRLLGLIHQYGEAIDADLRHYYPGHTLTDVACGRVTLRQFRVLIDGMPNDGTALWRTARDNAPAGKAKPPPDSWWTPERDLMATLSDQLATLTWLLSDDGKRNRNRPKPIERPGVARGRRMGRTSLPQSQVKAILAARGVRKEAEDG